MVKAVKFREMGRNLTWSIFGYSPTLNKNVKETTRTYIHIKWSLAW